MVGNFPQILKYNGDNHTIKSMTFEEVEFVCFSPDTAINTLAHIKSTITIPHEIYWPNIYMLTFYDSSDEKVEKFALELKHEQNINSIYDIVIKYFTIEADKHFNGLYFIHRYAHLSRKEICDLDYWYFQILVEEIKKQVKRDDDNRKSGQSLERD